MSERSQYMQIPKIIYICLLLLLGSCTLSVKEYISVDLVAQTTPQLDSCVLPPNIAPINISLPGKCVVHIFLDQQIIIEHYFKDRTTFKGKQWRSILKKGIGNKLEFVIYQQNDSTKKWNKFLPINVWIAEEPIDPYIAYRLIEPGYEAYKKMGLYQRSLESFQEKTIMNNSQTERNCINCHHFYNYDPSQFLFHMRGANGGTAFINNAQLLKIDLKTKNNISAGVYPSWHPSGKYVAFSTNVTHQSFHTAEDKRIEVYDLESDLILYDVANNRIINAPIIQNDSLWETFPTWSPDGTKLYFCRAEPENMPFDFAKLQYGIYSIDFDSTSGSFSETIDTVIQSSEHSYLFPRISPDGKLLLYTVAPSGTFPIWYHQSDLGMIDLQHNKSIDIDRINSDRTESYHSWSSNGRWIMFSSRRNDSLYTRVYFAYFDNEGNVHKPFILPQDKADYYMQKLQSYNIPEFISGEIEVSPYALEKLLKGQAIPTKP